MDISTCSAYWKVVVVLAIKTIYKLCMTEKKNRKFDKIDVKEKFFILFISSYNY